MNSSLAQWDLIVKKHIAILHFFYHLHFALLLHISYTFPEI